MPLAVQQKQIIVTCNYEARRHGLYKLQLVTEARRQCPEAIVVLGEDLTRFRNASKDNYNFLRRFAWSGKVERLGFDEIFIDVTDMIDYNLEMINFNALQSSFFYLARLDPTSGFTYDCSSIAGNTVPGLPDPLLSDPTNTGASLKNFDDTLYMRLLIGSHLAQYLRHQLEEHQGYTATVGISTNKLVSKLVGNVNKPKGQTTLLPPYTPSDTGESNITRFLDSHDIGKIPGIGFKSAQKIRDFVLSRPAAFDTGLVYGGTKEKVTVKDVRMFSSMGGDLLEKLLGGSGAPKSIGMKVWGLINGVDETEVSKAREVPQQISIEDSYIRLDAMTEVEKELRMLSRSLITRIRIDLSRADDNDQPLVDEDLGDVETSGSVPARQWLACPRTLRLTTRPRPPTNRDGTLPRIFTRTSRSCDMPSFVLSFSSSVEELSERLVQETLVPLFKKLHPEKSGWNLSLINLCVANMTLTAASAMYSAGRDISKMFKTQDQVLKGWKVKDSLLVAPAGPGPRPPDGSIHKEADDQLHCIKSPSGSQSREREWQEDEDVWQSDDEDRTFEYGCTTCGLSVPYFAIAAHERFHHLQEIPD
ncbi:MAG: hypothetical protein Q9202_006212 [Teloschistes flavicans]